MKNSLLSRFIPKQNKFFPLLNQLSQIVLNASRLLIDSMEYDTPKSDKNFTIKLKPLKKKETK